MTWPTAPVNTANCDAGTDIPATFRSDVYDAIQKLNAIIAIPPSPPFAAGTRIPFAQAAAPTYWTQDTTDAANNRMLRVVSSSGGATGGNTAHSPILMNIVPTHSHGSGTLVNGNDSPDHSHNATDSGHTHATGSAQVSAPGGAGLADVGYGTGGTGNGVAAISVSGRTVYHSHTITGSTDNNAGGGNWQPRYIDLIICSKD